MSTPNGLYYLTQWGCYARKFNVENIPPEVKHVCYAFWACRDDGTLYSPDDWADSLIFPKLQTWARQPGRAVSLSIFGWTLSANASTVFSTSQNIDRLIQGFKDLDTKYPGMFSGYGFDWEYPTNDGTNYGNTGNITRPQDADNFLAGLKQIRTAFPNKTLSICVTPDPSKMKMDIKSISQVVDQIHCMTYDCYSSSFGDTITKHQTAPRHSSLWTLSCEESADFYLQQGVPSTKLFIGSAFYSRGFANTTGLGKPCDPVVVSDMSWEPGVCDYKVLPLPGATEYVDPESKGAYSYDPVKKIINTYDNPESVKEKCKIVQEKNLGGIFAWELSGNSTNPSRSLTLAIESNLNTKPGQPSVPVVPTTPQQPTTPSVPVVPTTPQQPTTPSVPVVPTTPQQPVRPSVPVNTDIIFQGSTSVTFNNANVKVYKKDNKVYMDLDNATQLQVQPSVPVVPQTPSVPSVPVQQDKPQWSDNFNYKTGDKVTYLGNIYVCITSHHSLANWIPSIVPSLWHKIN